MVKAIQAHSRGEKKSQLRKKVSFKTKKHDIGSKRKLARFGKRIRAGHVGIATQYVSRTRALKQLQISLKDFRRLCILKGIYPRDPPRKPLGKQSTAYYHAKDIAFLQHEPILSKFREMKAVTKKISRRLGRNEKTEAARIYKKRPKYTLDHVVRERYPTFLSALGDLDDGLTLIHLFANLPIAMASQNHAQKCARIAREWQFYVARTKTLRKAFVSIKGIYYQCEVRGVAITWLVPHKFSQDPKPLLDNRQIDFKVMKTFLEFYETLLEFVLFKLYQEDLQSQYPPTVLGESDEAGNFLKAMRAVPTNTPAPPQPSSLLPKQSNGNGNGVKKPKTTPSSSLEKVLEKVAKNIKNKNSAKEEEEEEEENDEVVDSNDFREDSQLQSIMENEKTTDMHMNLFRHMTFFLSREVPLEPLEFCIESFGGVVVREDLNEGGETDPSITHFVTDRTLSEIRSSIKSREYIQPQWVFDCINHQVLLPVKEYHPEVTSLPPHLSPFVDNEQEGYRPSRLDEIEELKMARAKDGGTIALLKASGMIEEETNDKDIVPDSSDEEEEEEEDEEEEKPVVKQKLPLIDPHDEAEVDNEQGEQEQVEGFVPNLKDAFIPATKFEGRKEGFFFRRGTKGTGYYRDETSNIPEFNAKAEEKQVDKMKSTVEKKEAKEMRTIVMSKKAKNLYDRMQYGIAKKKDHVSKLETKRARLSQ